MTLQYIFINNLKKFRKLRGLSQMGLARLCDTSGNYIGEIEMGRRIPSFEKIEDIAAALRIPSYQLFVEKTEEIEEHNQTETEPRARDFLAALPNPVKEEITAHLLASLQRWVSESFDAQRY